MALDDDIRILSKVGLFETFNGEQLRLLAFGAERLVLRAGRELFHEGQSADCAYIVVSGHIVLFHRLQNERVPVRSVHSGSIIGEMALIAQSDRLTGALAEEETEVIRLSRTVFRRILEEYPELAANLYQRISEDLNKMVGDIEKISHHFTEQD
ncbi:cyclic nucleotide-binding domain-containing protein [Paenochrobactrum sp. BZR 588]|uniref:cyclic nucleotide-binding domain-containing protein n=1 Tax=Paenochrobactrum TaxID=999488 RepID=UPI0035BBB327